MNKLKKKLKIAVLDDSIFFNKLISKQVEAYTRGLSLDRGFDYSINSYIHADDFLRNLKSDTDIAFIDFYLGEGFNGATILKTIKNKCENCEVVIISQAKNIQTVVKTIENGAAAFIYKDNKALAKTCFFIEHFANHHYPKWEEL